MHKVMRNLQTIGFLLGLFSLALVKGAQAQSPFTFSTFDVPGATGGAEIYDINEGNLVGDYYDAAGEHGFVYNGSSYTYLNDPLATAGTSAVSMDGNNIVGEYFNSIGLHKHGFIYNGASYQTIDNPLAAVDGTVIGQISGDTVVGYYRDINAIGHGFLYNINTKIFTTMDVPNATGGTFLIGISGSTLYGAYDDAAGEHGFIDSSGTFTTINVPASTLTDVFRGSGSTFTGKYGTTGSSHGFFFDGTNYINLDYPGASDSLTFPSGIYGNTIVGSYNDSNNIPHGFEATYSPAGGSDTPVMPSWILVVFAGLLVLTASRRLS